MAVSFFDKAFRRSYVGSLFGFVIGIISIPLGKEGICKNGGGYKNSVTIREVDEALL